MRYVTTGGIKQMGTHNRSENGRDACVTLCGFYTHADTHMYTFPINTEAFFTLSQGSLNFYLLFHLEQLWGPYTLLFNGYLGSIPGYRGAGA
jgi:hypothetical protein